MAYHLLMDHIVVFYLRVNSSAFAGWFLKGGSSCRQPSGAWFVGVTARMVWDVCFDGAAALHPQHLEISLWGGAHILYEGLFCLNNLALSNLALGSQAPEHCKEVCKS